MKRFILLPLVILLLCAVTAWAQGSRGWSKFTGGVISASPKLADLNGDGQDEILLVSSDPGNPYGAGYLNAWYGDGTVVSGFPVYLSGASFGTPAIGDIDGDGDMEIVAGTWKNLYVLNADGTNVSGWPKALYITQPAALADLDGDLDLEILVPSNTSLRVYHHDGTNYSGFPVYGTNDLTSPAVGDMDGDGDLEVVSGSFKASGSPSEFINAWHHDGSVVSGFPVPTQGAVRSCPALADLDADGTLEVIADTWNNDGSNQDYLYVWDHQGNAEAGWPVQIKYIRGSSPSAADLDLDGDLEIVVGGWNTSPVGEMVHAYHHDANPVSGFPITYAQSISGNVNSTCTVGDIDGDAYPEIVVKIKNNILALNNDGTIVSGFPIFLDDQSHSATFSPSPALGDPDGDGLVEIFAAAAFDEARLIDRSGIHMAADMDWPTFRNDAQNRGTFGVPALPLTADIKSIQESTGGAVNLALDAGVASGNRNYLIVGSATGISPGIALPGGMATLPLKWDIFTNIVIANLNTPLFFNFLGVTNGAGQASAKFDTILPLPAGTAGLRFYFAYAMDKPWDFASNPVGVLVVP